ncbi:DUF6229 family protein [Nonomuraea sp. NPDC050404]|uniref:DUF6229 family protein n=1 Tax=Nonomuraea sp. NPDC050404 TaxID=3155783 RepID=UPI0033D70A5A
MSELTQWQAEEVVAAWRTGQQTAQGFDELINPAGPLFGAGTDDLTFEPATWGNTRSLANTRTANTGEINTRTANTRTTNTRQINTRTTNTRDINTRTANTRDINTRTTNTRQINTRTTNTREMAGMRGLANTRSMANTRNTRTVRFEMSAVS